MEENSMTNAELKAFLETLAKLIEASAQDAKKAAEIVRAAKEELNK